jgi:hypothetical protein
MYSDVDVVVTENAEHCRHPGKGTNEKCDDHNAMEMFRATRTSFGSSISGGVK